MSKEFIWYLPDKRNKERASIWLDFSFKYKKELQAIKEKDTINKIHILLKLLENHHINTLAHTFEDAFLATILVDDYFGNSQAAEPFIEEVFLGSLLHDIGKVAVPVEIMNSDKSSLPQELKQILNLHGYFGSELLRRVGLDRYAYFCDEHHIGNSTSPVFTKEDIENRHPLTEFLSMADVISGMMDTRRKQNKIKPKKQEEVIDVIYQKYKNGKYSSELIDSFQRVVVNRNMFPPFFSTEAYGTSKVFMNLIDKYKLGDMLRRAMVKGKK